MKIIRAFLLFSVCVLMLPQLLLAATISLNGFADRVIDVERGGAYTEPGGTVFDDTYSGASWGDVTVSGSVDANAAEGATFVLTYTYRNPTNPNITASAQRTVRIVDTSNSDPIISVASTLTITEGDSFDITNHAIVLDAEDGSCTGGAPVNTCIVPSTHLSVSGDRVNTNSPGEYIVLLEYVDGGGKTAREFVTVRVEAAPALQDSSGSSAMRGQGDAIEGTESDSGKLVPCGVKIAITGGSGGQICYVGECSVCHVQILAQRVMNFFVVFVVVVAAVLFTNAGTLYVFSPTNPGNISRAHRLFTNTLIGLIIVLSAYMLVDVVMHTLYDATGTRWGPWNSFLCKDASVKKCYDPLEQITIGSQQPTSGVATAITENRTTAAGSGAQCPPGNTACSITALMNAGLSNIEQANVMSCIAMTESSGNSTWGPYNERHPGSNSSACGTFQIQRTTWGRGVPGCEDWRSNCQIAECNARVMARLVTSRRSNPYSDWTCPTCNNKAAGCINMYSTPK